MLAGDRVCVLAIGKLVETALKAAAEFAPGSVEVWDVRSCLPLDPDMLAAAARFGTVITAEDGVRAGGVGMAIADELHRLAPGVRVEVLGLPTKFLAHGDAKQILATHGLDTAGLANAIRAAGSGTASSAD